MIIVTRLLVNRSREKYSFFIGIIHYPPKVSDFEAGETAALGDQLIDQSVLDYAGLAIAMENAPDALKHIANRIAPSKDADGVAWAQERILANNADHD
jgi:3-deoxy-D-manno-octulosonate 8-phosphate phosphatase KdsC-like HAD superfamily phosphatase